MRSRKILNIDNVKDNISNLFKYPRINKVEKAMLMDAINNNNGEIIEPANDDNKTMEVIVGLYNKKLVEIDFERDKLFVSERGLESLAH